MFLNAQRDNKAMGRYFFNAKCYIGKIVGRIDENNFNCRHLQLVAKLLRHCQ